MRDLIISIFGEYTPVTTQVVSSEDPSVVVDQVLPGLAGVDWPYIAGIVLFGISLYMVLSIIRSVIYRV